MSETEINSISEASAAIAAYEPPQLFGLTVRKVPWMKLPELMEQLDSQILAAIRTFADEETGDPGPVLVSSLAFANKLLLLSCRIDSAKLESLDMDWDQGAQLAALAVKVNIQDLKAVIGFFADALKDALSGFRSKSSADGSESSKPDEG